MIRKPKSEWVFNTYKKKADYEKLPLIMKNKDLVKNLSNQVKFIKTSL